MRRAKPDRFSSCQDKVRYATEETAKKKVVQLGKDKRYYKCGYCQGFHITSKRW